MTDLIADRWLLDRPNSYIGRSVPRPNAPRLAEGRGAFVDDIETGGGRGTWPSCALPMRMPGSGPSTRKRPGRHRG